MNQHKIKTMAHQIFPRFSFKIIGDNTARSPFGCNDPIHFEIRNAMANEYFEIIFPINSLKNETAVISDYLITDAQGNADYFFNSGGCLKYNGEALFSQQDQYGWKLNPGTYEVALRWFRSQVPMGKVTINVTN